MRCPAALVAVVTGVLALVPATTAQGAAPGAAPARPAPNPAQWWMAPLRAKDLWAAGATGKGVIVAVIDDGVAGGRPELAGHVLSGAGDSGTNGWARATAPGHGTHMATLIAGQGGPDHLVGLAPDARILPYGQTLYSAHRLNDKVKWAIDRGAKVINMSFAGAGACIPQEAAAARYAVEHGAVMVAGAGNNGDTYSGPLSPASCPGVLTVGGVTRGDHVWPKSSPGSYVDVAAPAADIIGQGPDGRLWSFNGTSDATALTSAAVADVWSLHPELTNRQVVARILATVHDDADHKGKDDRTGYGVIDPYRAATADVPLDAPNPVFDELPGPTPTSPPAPTASTTNPPADAAAGSPASAAPATGGGTPWPLIGAGAAALALAAGTATAVVLRRRRYPGV